MRGNLDLRRVEDSCGAGFPDVDGFARLAPDNAVHFSTAAEREEYAREHSEPFAFKLELKSELRPAKAATPIRFKVQKRFAQLEFMRKRYTMGESAYFLLQVGEASGRRLYLAPGDCGRQLKAGISESELAVLCATQDGMVFDSKVKPAQIIERIRACSLRRYFR